MSDGDARAQRRLVINQNTFSVPSGQPAPGITIQDQSFPTPNGVEIRLNSSTQTYFNTLGTMGTLIFFGQTGYQGNLSAFSGNSLDIGSSTVRFRDIYANSFHAHTGSGFTGSAGRMTHGALQTTTNTQQTLYSSPTLIDNSATFVEAHVIASRGAAGTDRGYAVRRALITRAAGGAAALVGAVDTTYTNLPATWSVTIGTFVNTFRVLVQDSAGANPINWAATIFVQSVSGNT